MPSRQPFTSLCQATARPRHTGRADLHTHTTASDGVYTPAQVVDLAHRCALAAVAITDHDTLAAIEPARRAAAGTGVEVISGVEISAEYHGLELHLLAYFVDPLDAPLNAALALLREHRVTRFLEMARRLQSCGVPLDEAETQQAAHRGSVGRPHLAELIVKAKRAGSVRDAFLRYLGDQGSVAVPKRRLDVKEAIALVRGAGGVSSWAHPPPTCDRAALEELRGWGLTAVEVEYPGLRSGRQRELRGWARELGLAITGGSDCHGPGDHRRTVGSSTIGDEELLVLRKRAGVKG